MGIHKTFPKLSPTHTPAVKSARVMQVIETVHLEGAGTETEPCYMQRQYWTLDGKLLAISAPTAR